MERSSVADILSDVDNIASYFRTIDHQHTVYAPLDGTSFPDEYTNWIEEQRAVQETCALVDQSHHMINLRMEGPDAIDFFDHIGVNNFDNFRNGKPPLAKHLVMVNEEGHMIRDTVLFYLPDRTIVSVGSPVGNNWIAFNAEQSDFDVTCETPTYSPIGTYEPIGSGDIPPRDFRFEIQGPNALDVMENVVDGDLERIPFFKIGELSIGGHDLLALGHGMAEAPGLEIFGPYELHDEIWQTIVSAGEDYGLREMGSKTYKTGKIGSGWIKLPVPAIYTSEEMSDYRQWLGSNSIEGQLAIGGSFRSEDIEDYYMNPFEMGYGRHVDLDTEFIGRDALNDLESTNTRVKVTFVWDPEDFADIFKSLVEDGPNYKFIDIPDTANRWSKTHYDAVLDDTGDVVGIGKYPGYLFYERSMLSLGVVEEAYSDPGTELTMLWGEPDSPKSNVERHEMKEVTVTIEQSPFVQGGRKDQ